MSRRFAAIGAFVVAALVAAPIAAADGPMPFASQGGLGVTMPDGLTRLVAVGAGIAGTPHSKTELEVIQTKDGSVQTWVEIPGSWGVPVITYSQSGAEGLSADGKTLVLGDVVRSYPRLKSSFLVVNAKTLRIMHTIELKGDFAYDALSPDGNKLYLIDHVDSTNAQRYVVRAYDVAADRLLPGRIADRTQKSWVMQGYPMARTTSADGRWVYTLYSNPGGYSFVHALDTQRGVAHCIGLPWRGSQNGFYNLRLSLRNNNRTLAVHWLSGRPWFAIDTGTWHVAQDHRIGLPWVGIGAGCAAVLAAAVAFLLLRRRRRAEELDEELSELLRLPNREVVA